MEEGNTTVAEVGGVDLVSTAVVAISLVFVVVSAIILNQLCHSLMTGTKLKITYQSLLVEREFGKL